MSSPASSPSTTPSRPSSSRVQTQCISELSEITNQLLDNEAAIRFQCLAYYRIGRSPIQRRCEESCETQAKPQIFKQAKQILQRYSSVTFEEYVGSIIRILFCKTHNEAITFKKYYDSLELGWRGHGAPEELQLLRAIRQAYQLPLVEPIQAPNSLQSSPTLPSNLSSPQLELRSTNQDERKPEVSPTPTYMKRVVGSPQMQAHSLDFGDTSLSQRKHLVPSPPSQRIRSRSNPLQLNENNFTQVSSVHANSIIVGESMPSYTCSTPSGILSAFQLSSPAYKIQFSPRLVNDEMPKLQSALPVSPTSAEQADIITSATAAPSKGVSHSVPETVSTNSQSDNSKPGAFHGTDFLPDNWENDDPSSSIASSGSRKVGFRPTPMPKSSKDDTFLEQLSNSVADTAPTLFEATIQHEIPVPTPNNRLGKNPKFYVPVIVDNWIREAVKKPVTKEGFIYVLKAPKYFEENYPEEQPRVKIGISVDVNSRIAQLKRDCGISDLERIDDREDRPHRWYYKVEELAHSELANFRRVLNCDKCKTAHQEWFAVSEEVALETVQRWRRFIFEEPYDDNGLLKDQWSEMLRPAKMMWPTREEEYDDHEKRNDRWNRWLNEGIKSTCLLT